jgi:hypothetical protein
MKLLLLINMILFLLCLNVKFKCVLYCSNINTVNMWSISSTLALCLFPLGNTACPFEHRTNCYLRNVLGQTDFGYVQFLKYFSFSQFSFMLRALLWTFQYGQCREEYYMTVLIDFHSEYEDGSIYCSELVSVKCNHYITLVLKSQHKKVKILWHDIQNS